MAAIFLQHAIALVLAAQAAQDATGTAVTPIPKTNERDDDDQTWSAVFEVTQIGAGTIDAVVEGSWDGDTWHTLAAMTQLVAAGPMAEIKALTVLPPQVRARVTRGNTATWTGTVRLVSNKSWRNGISGASA